MQSAADAKPGGLTRSLETREELTVDLVRDSACAILNLYGPRHGMRVETFLDLAPSFIDQLKLQGQLQAGFYQGLGEDGFEWLLQTFYPVPAPDAAVIQLVVNRSGEAAEAWRAISTRVARLLAQTNLTHAWGASLIFQADYTGKTVEPGEFTETLNPLLVFLDPALAASQADGQRAYLAAAPGMVPGLPGLSIYVVLTEPQTAGVFMMKTFLGPAAAFSMPDLICHKSYHQAREWQNETVYPAYRQRMEDMMNASHQVIVPGAIERNRSESLETLARSSEQMMVTLTHLERLQVSLARQLANLEPWLDQGCLVELFLEHRQRLRVSATELELAVAEGHSVWEASRYAVQVTTARMQVEQGRRQELLAQLLAVLGVMLAVPQVVDREVVAALLSALGWLSPGQAAPTLVLLGVQLLLLTAIGGAIGLTIHLMMTRRSTKGE